MSVERQPLTKMQSAASDLQTKLPAYGKVQRLRVDPARRGQQAVQVGHLGRDHVHVGGYQRGDGLQQLDLGGRGHLQRFRQCAGHQPEAVASGSFSDKTATLGSGSLSIEIGSWSADQKQLFC